MFQKIDLMEEMGSLEAQSNLSLCVINLIRSNKVL